MTFARMDFAVLFCLHLRAGFTTSNYLMDGMAEVLGVFFKLRRSFRQFLKMLHSDDRPQRRRESYSDHREERSYKREVYDVRDKRDSHRASMGDRDRDQDMRPRDSYPPKQRRDDRDDYYSNDNKRSAGNSRGYDERPPRRDRRDTADAKPSNQLGLFGFDRDHTEQDLEDEFNRYGTVENAVIIYVKGVRAVYSVC